MKGKELNLIEDEEYILLSSFLKKKYVSPKVKSIVINQHSQDYTFEDDLESATNTVKDFPGVTPDMIQDFKIKNKKPAKFEKKFNLKVDCILLNENEKKKIFNSDMLTKWDNFFKLYPNSAGLFDLSRVGLNKKKDKAIFLASRGFGTYGGEVKSYLMEKIKGLWQVKSENVIFLC